VGKGRPNAGHAANGAPKSRDIPNRLAPPEFIPARKSCSLWQRPQRSLTL
jgi:hypothetical protein